MFIKWQHQSHECISSGTKHLGQRLLAHPSCCPAAAQPSTALRACPANRIRELIWLGKKKTKKPTTLKHPAKSNMFFFPARIASPIWPAAQLHKQLRQHGGGADRERGLRGLVQAAPPMKGKPPPEPTTTHRPPARDPRRGRAHQPSSRRVRGCPAFLPHAEGNEQ